MERIPKKYQCECGKSYVDSYNFTIHKRLHANPELFKCDEEGCGKLFTMKASLKGHKKVHTGESEVKCDICGKILSDQVHLKNHMHVHTLERPFKCPECDKSFRQSSALSRHKKSHRGELPYVCEECNRSFSQRSSFVRHLMTHTHDKCFPCEEKGCQKSFYTSWELVKHQKIHKPREERPRYTCEICGKSYIMKHGLKGHMRVHKGETPFKCSYPGCQREYVYQQSLITHYSAHLR